MEAEQEVKEGMKYNHKVTQKPINSLSAALMEIGKIKQFHYLKQKKAAAIIKTNQHKILVIFKRQYYHNFKHHFPHIKKDNGKPYGYAQIISLELLNYAIIKNIDRIVFVMPDRKIYETMPGLIHKYHKKYKTEVPYLKEDKTAAIPLEYFLRTKI